MFLDFVGEPYPWIYIPTNIKELPCIVLMQQTSCPQKYVPTNQQNFDNTWKLAPTNKNNSTVFLYSSLTEFPPPKKPNPFYKRILIDDFIYFCKHEVKY